MDITTLAGLVEESVTWERKASDLYWQPYYHLLFLLAREMGGPCVELGVEKGRGSRAMLEGGAEVWGYDHELREEIQILTAEHRRQFHFFNESSLPVPDSCPADVRVLHVDTEHSFAQAREEFRAYQSKLAIPSVVCFDDTHAMESEVGHFVATLRYPTIFDDRLHTSCGYAVMLYTGDMG